MIFKEAHKRFKNLEMYSYLKKYSYLLVLIGFLFTLELFFYFIDSNLRPIGEIFSVILPDIMTESRSNSLYPIVVEGNQSLYFIIMFFGMGICGCSFIMFVAYLNCFYKTIQSRR